MSKFNEIGPRVHRSSAQMTDEIGQRDSISKTIYFLQVTRQWILPQNTQNRFFLNHLITFSIL